MNNNHLLKIHPHIKIAVLSGAFKDVYDPFEACDAIASVVKKVVPNSDVYTFPLSDGGEFAHEVLQKKVEANAINATNIVDAHGRIIDTHYLELATETVFISSYNVLRCLPEKFKKQNPLQLTSFGLGQMIRQAQIAGYRHIVIGLGGTITADAGIGLGQALGIRFLDERRQLIVPPKEYFFVSELEKIKFVDLSESFLNNSQITLDVICDATASLNQIKVPLRQKIGPEFSWKKEALVSYLYRLITQYAGNMYPVWQTGNRHDCYSEEKLNNLPFLGVAGGMLITLNLFKLNKVELGSKFFIDKLDLRNQIKNSDIIITGEGKLDNSFLGKTPVGVSRLAQEFNKPLIYIVGDVDDSLKPFFQDGIAKSLPSEYKENGINIVLSCHQANDRIRLPIDFIERIEYFRKNTPVIFTQILSNLLNRQERP